MAAPKLQLIAARDFAKPEPARYLVDGRVEDGELFGLIGQRKSAKSYVALDLAFAVAQGRTWAGCKVERPGPVGAGVAADGLLLTEFPPGERPNAGSFPRRNRLISGLARVTVVVEATVTPPTSPKNPVEISEVRLFAEAELPEILSHQTTDMLHDVRAARLTWE